MAKHKIKILKYIKVHTATRWTIRHSLTLLWFADLMNVTEEVTIHRPNASTLLSSAFIMTQVDLAFKFPKLNSMRECLIRKNGTSFFAIGLDGEKKWTFFSAAMQEMKHQGFDFRRHLYLEEDTFNAKKREIIFFLLFIKFSIQSAVLLTVSIVLSFYI